MTDSPAFFWILMQRLPGLSAAEVRRLAGHGMVPDLFGAAPDSPHGDPDRWLGLSPDALAGRGLSAKGQHAIAEWQRQGRRHPAARQATQDCAWLKQHDARLLYLTHPDYPPLLGEIADPPPWLYVQGDPALLARPQLAVIGSRRPSHSGLDNARAFAGELAAAGFVITSGLAYGIDAAAHRAAIDAGGNTVAIFGTGLDQVYPARHAELARAVTASGALVSELPLGARPLPGHFPRRNRIISGLSLGVLVVEAAPQSGSLVTARLALEQNREVYALPGSIHNPASRGCNALIRQGATLVQTVSDIREELSGWCAVPERIADSRAEGRPWTDCGSGDLPLAADSVEAGVLASVGFEPTALDAIVERSGLPVPQVLAVMAELELLGVVEMRGGNWQRRAD